MSSVHTDVPEAEFDGHTLGLYKPPMPINIIKKPYRTALWRLWFDKRLYRYFFDGVLMYL